MADGINLVFSMTKESQVSFVSESKHFEKKTKEVQAEYFNLLKTIETSRNFFSGQDSFQFIIGDQITLMDAHKNKICIDFDKPNSTYYRKSVSKNDLLLKAIGLGKGTSTVLDLTAGLLVDAAHFLAAGLKVTALERSPEVYFLLQKSLEKSERQDFKNHLKLVFTEAKDYLKFLKKGDANVDVIYFDPMYALKKKSALPKQEMVLFHGLVGEDLDAQEVLKLALDLRPQRVVVKRHLSHPPLSTGVKHSFIGKAVRYDYY